MNASGNGKMKTHDSSRQQGSKGRGQVVLFFGGRGDLVVKLYLDLGLGGSEINAKRFVICFFPTVFPLF